MLPFARSDIPVRVRFTAATTPKRRVSKEKEDEGEIEMQTVFGNEQTDEEQLNKRPENDAKTEEFAVAFAVSSSSSRRRLASRTPKCSSRLFLLFRGGKWETLLACLAPSISICSGRPSVRPSVRPTPPLPFIARRTDGRTGERNTAAGCGTRFAARLGRSPASTKSQLQFQSGAVRATL